MTTTYQYTHGNNFWITFPYYTRHNVLEHSNNYQSGNLVNFFANTSENFYGQFRPGDVVRMYNAGSTTNYQNGTVIAAPYMFSNLLADVPLDDDYRNNNSITILVNNPNWANFGGMQKIIVQPPNFILGHNLDEEEDNLNRMLNYLNSNMELRKQLTPLDEYDNGISPIRQPFAFKHKLKTIFLIKEQGNFPNTSPSFHKFFLPKDESAALLKKCTITLNWNGSGQLPQSWSSEWKLNATILKNQFFNREELSPEFIEFASLTPEDVLDSNKELSLLEFNIPNNSERSAGYSQTLVWEPESPIPMYKKNGFPNFISIKLSRNNSYKEINGVEDLIRPVVNFEFIGTSKNIVTGQP